MSFAWSWSALESFETCPKKHFHTRVRKDVKEPEGEALTWGKRVHDALSLRIDKGRKLPSDMPYEEHVEKVMENSDRTQVVMKTEQRLALTVDLSPCDFFDKKVDPWVRSVADVLKVRQDPGIARVIDWKTGKGKFYPDPVSGEPVATEPGQLRLAAAVVFAHYPTVEVVRTQYFWLQEGVETEETFTRRDLPKIWSQFLPRVDAMEKAFRTNDFPTKRSGLCVRHCPVSSCPYHGKRPNE